MSGEDAVYRDAVLALRLERVSGMKKLKSVVPAGDALFYGVA